MEVCEHLSKKTTKTKLGHGCGLIQPISGKCLGADIVIRCSTEGCVLCSYTQTYWSSFEFGKRGKHGHDRVVAGKKLKEPEDMDSLH